MGCSVIYVCFVFGCGCFLVGRSFFLCCCFDELFLLWFVFGVLSCGSSFPYMLSTCLLVGGFWKLSYDPFSIDIHIYLKNT